MRQARNVFSPRQVAQAIGVSESSLKRWCDAGKISSFKTTGGHRRMTAADVIGFARTTRFQLANPAAIGLPSCQISWNGDIEGVVKQLTQMLIEGEAQPCRDVILQTFVQLWPMEAIVDELIAPAFREIGHRFDGGRVEVYQERRACEICLNTLREIRSLISKPPENAPLAIGGSAENDHYSLPTHAVELTLASHGWNAHSLGSNLPFQSFREALRIERPRLLWMSISHLSADEIERQRFQQQLNQLASDLPQEVTFVIGGQAISSAFRNGLKSIVVCDNLSQLVALTKNF